MVRIAIILGSTRPVRNGEAVAQWVLQHAQQRTDAEFELIDLAEVDLPKLDEPTPAAWGKYALPHTQQWAQTIASFDGFVFVTPQYNHSFPGSLKNAIDRLAAEWNNKAAGFVCYGVDSGVRAAEALRPVLAALQVATVCHHVGFSLRTDFENFGAKFTPAEYHEGMLNTMFDQLISWSTALAGVRNAAAPAAV